MGIFLYTNIGYVTDMTDSISQFCERDSYSECEAAVVLINNALKNAGLKMDLVQVQYESLGEYDTELFSIGYKTGGYDIFNHVSNEPFIRSLEEFKTLMNFLGNDENFNKVQEFIGNNHGSVISKIFLSSIQDKIKSGIVPYISSFAYKG